MQRFLTFCVLVLVISGCGNDERDELPAVLQAWEEAAMAGDAAAMAALYTEDGVYYDLGIPRTLEGRGNIESALKTAFPYLTITEMELVSAVRTGDTIDTKWRWSGTSSVHGRLAADQTPFSAEVEFVFVLQGDAISSSQFIYEYDSVFN